VIFQELTESRSFDWAEYLDQFHTHYSGITERLLERAKALDIGTPYEWLGTQIKLLPGMEDTPVSILDVGCGSAPMRAVLPGHWNYLGIDLSLSELRKAQEAGRKHVIVADATQLPLSANSMDAAISSMAMMLVTPVELAFSEIYRVLKPGAVFAFTRPSTAPLLPRDLLVGLRLITALRALPAMPQRFTERRVQGLLERAGFVGIRHERKRFSFVLRTLDDAKLLVNSLYLPDRTEEHRLRAADILASWALKSRDIPVSIAMTVANKSISPNK
jgi:ubiquinone/menaquinone biosynthesis C-methylase UbiE